MSKMRLDVFLTENGFVQSREKARALIMAGKVNVDGKRCDKAGTQITGDENIEVKDELLRYVSRGGLKIEHALDEFNINPSGRTCIDAGASTGGFTDCLLQRGAQHVYAIDVGYGQLDWKLRNDSRVTVFEKTNIRYFEREKIGNGPVPDLAVIDVSFIGLTKVLMPVALLLHCPADIVALIKPQFEAGRDDVGKGGVVRDSAVHERVIESVKSFCLSNDMEPVGVTTSPITGPKGNVEFLIHIHLPEHSSCWTLDKKPDSREDI